MLIYSYINTSGNWKNEKLCGNTTPAGRSVFTQFRVFPIFTSVDIIVYQYEKNVLYFFYNIAQRTLTEKWREIVRVDMSYINTALSQSAFRIYKCYIINTGRASARQHTFLTLHKIFAFSYQVPGRVMYSRHLDWLLVEMWVHFRGAY